MKRKRARSKKEFGDFQTPEKLALTILNLLKQAGILPVTIIEPTCGVGSFVLASVKTYPDARIFGMDVNSDYIDTLRGKLSKRDLQSRVKIKKADFFKTNWSRLINSLQEPFLIVGNPPWVTSSEISSINGSNIPVKSNIYTYDGIEAITGKSNFDISEWMTITLLSALNGSIGTLAFLCKLQVARKVLMYISKNKLSISSSSMHLINAKEHFNATVDACLYICNLKPNSSNYTCKVYQYLDFASLIQEIGFLDNQLIADIPSYQQWKHLQGESPYIWRSGVKHDCAKVMELQKKGEPLYNRLGEVVRIEDDYLYPLLKSSDLANNRTNDTSRWMLVTQQHIGEDTAAIRDNAPLTWSYLERNADRLDKRASSIYNKRPRYSIFGVGSYAFSSWKIAISGFYKQLNFRLISPLYEKPVVFDDTCYFIPIQSREEALIIHTILSHPIVQKFYSSFIFWDAKRPISKEILQRLALNKLYHEIGSKKVLDIIKKNHNDIDSDDIAVAAIKLSESE